MRTDLPRPLRFEAHFREVVAGIRRYAVRTVGATHADDIVSETLTIAWRRWDDAPAEPEVRRAWTFTIAHNVVAHHVRAESRRLQLVARAVQEQPGVEPDATDSVVLEDWARRAIAELPLAEREALALVVFADLAPDQVAAVLGCSVTALSSRLSRARKRVAVNQARLRETERVGMTG